jgi:hypothetical protein
MLGNGLDLWLTPDALEVIIKFLDPSDKRLYIDDFKIDYSLLLFQIEKQASMLITKAVKLPCIAFYHSLLESI